VAAKYRGELPWRRRAGRRGKSCIEQPRHSEQQVVHLLGGIPPPSPRKFHATDVISSHLAPLSAHQPQGKLRYATIQIGRRHSATLGPGESLGKIFRCGLEPRCVCWTHVLGRRPSVPGRPICCSLLRWSRLVTGSEPCEWRVSGQR